MPFRNAIFAAYSAVSLDRSKRFDIMCYIYRSSIIHTKRNSTLLRCCVSLLNLVSLLFGLVIILASILRTYLKLLTVLAITLVLLCVEVL